MPNITPTKHAQLLIDALRKRGVEIDDEYWDHHKHVDIYIPKGKIYIEIDGTHHYTRSETIISDFKRDFFSSKEGFLTKRITNEAIDAHLEEIADAICEVVKNTPNIINEEVISKLKPSSI